MIERMRKLTVVALRDGTDGVLHALQELGVCHVQESGAPDSPQAGALRERIARLESQTASLDESRTRYGVNLPQKRRGFDAEAVLAELEALQRERESLLLRLGELRRHAALWRPFGSLDPALVEALEKEKIRMAFCSCARQLYPKLKPGALAVELIKEDHASAYYVVFYRKSARLGPDEKLLLSNQLEMPRVSLASLDDEIAEAEDRLQDTDRALLDRTKYLEPLAEDIERSRDELAFHRARASLAELAEGGAAVLQGWVAADDIRSVGAALDVLPVVWYDEEPSHADTVPTKLKQSPFARLFQPILKLFNVPAYGELDPTPFFAPFYTLFFGLCLADTGYGAIMVIACLIALLIAKKAKTRSLILLGLVLGLSVIFGGILVDDYFGERLATEYAAEVPGEGGNPVFEIGHLFEPLSWLKTRDAAMRFPLMLGVIHIVLGWALRMVNQYRHCGWQGLGQPLGNILVLAGLLFWASPSFLGPDFMIGPFGIGRLLCAPGSAAGGWILVAGLALILFFNGAEKRRKVWVRPLAGLWSLYELSTGLISDILSYLRLFALGLAGGLLAEAVNNIARDMVRGTENIGAYLGMVLVLVFGHSLNFGLGLLSAFVHSLRLQFVEFYKALEYRGGGVEFRPLKAASLAGKAKVH